MDKIGLCCKGDELIRKFGERLFLKHGHDVDQLAFIRNSLRELGRLLLKLRVTVGPLDADLRSLINPGSFQQVAATARDIAGFDNTSHTYDTPSLAKKLGGSLKACAGILKKGCLDSSRRQQKARST